MLGAVLGESLVIAMTMALDAGTVYVAARRRLHNKHLLRCDWISALG